MTAQICNGSLGDPVVNIDFGSGPNPGPALSTKLPNLSYSNSTCPNDGFYTLANSTQGCFNSTWHSYTTDHTPNDANGYMMLINASLNSGDFYVDTVKGLCAGTTYEFAAWVTNVFFRSNFCASSIKPNLQFSIETTSGTVLATSQTGDIPDATSATWKQYGIYFTTPANTQIIVLRIANKAPGGCGNDLALDDITFRPCGPIVTISTGSGSSTIDQCVGNTKPVVINASLGVGYNNPTALWQKSEDNGITWTNIGVGNTNPFQYSYLLTTVGSVKLRVTVAESGNIGTKECRIASNELTLTVHEKPGKGSSGNSPVCSNDMILLDGGTGSTFSWKGPNGFSSNNKSPSIKAALNGTGWYYVQASDVFGCVGNDSVFVQVNNAPTASLAQNADVCEGVSTVLTASGGTSYKWSPSSGLSADNIAAPIATPTVSQTYTVVVANAGCKDTASIDVNVLESPTADAGADKFIFEGQSTVLDGKAGGDSITWHWIPNTAINNTTSITPTVSPMDNITYQLLVESTNGCPTSTDEVFVRVFKKLVIPNAFSPNNDGINDSWRIEALITYPEAEILIFDRFGKSVFQSKGYSKEWDGTFNGKPVPVGMYYYTIDVKNGSPVLTGSILVVR